MLHLMLLILPYKKNNRDLITKSLLEYKVYDVQVKITKQLKPIKCVNVILIWHKIFLKGQEPYTDNKSTLNIISFI